MSVEKIEYTMELPKETKEIADAVILITQHFMEKKPIAEITALIPSVIAAVDGFDKVDDELKSEYRDELAGYLVHKLMHVLLPVKK